MAWNTYQNFLFSMGNPRWGPRGGWWQCKPMILIISFIDYIVTNKPHISFKIRWIAYMLVFNQSFCIHENLITCGVKSYTIIYHVSDTVNVALNLSFSSRMYPFLAMLANIDSFQNIWIWGETGELKKKEFWRI